MKKGTIYLTRSVNGCDWFHVYEFVKHDEKGVTARDGQNNLYFFPAHMIERIEYDN